MGQKVHPTGFRIDVVEDWRSRWYARKKEYGQLLVEDTKIRGFVKNYPFAADVRGATKLGLISMIEIERSREAVRITIHTASPGLIIGKRGSKVDELTKQLEEMIGKRIDLKIHEIEKPELESQLVAEAIAEQLQKRAPFRRTIRKAAETSMSMGAGGVKIHLAGRIGGAEIARDEGLAMGKVPLSTLRADISYGQAEAVLSKGKIGVKVWIFRGEKFGKRGQQPAAEGQAAAAPAPGGAPVTPLPPRPASAGTGVKPAPKTP
ncbi:MAG: 30S ribosomal protein S3 [Planctomycetota bacterium]